MSAAGRCSSLAAILLVLLVAGTRAATYSVTGFSDTAVVTGLDQPTDFAFLPDGRLLIIEKPGRIKIAPPGGGAAVLALDMTASVNEVSERGLLGICLHPQFATNGYLFAYYTVDPSPRNRISRFTLVGSTISQASEVVVLDNISAAAGNHNGGTILIGPDGKLYAAPGDAGTSSNAQITSPGNFSGKVLRMELDGSPAAGNPHLGDGTWEQRIFAHGFRNPFRFSFRPNGSLYVGDVGSSGTQDREELNVVVSGGNYGWPWAEGTTIYTPPCTGCLPPVFDYPRATGTTIIGGAFVVGQAYPSSLQGRYVFGDNGASWIDFLEFTAGDALVGGLNTPHLASAAEGPVAFHLGLDGYIYYAAINAGRIYRINFPKRFNTVAPCRIVDTRGPAGPYGGPALAAGADRTFVLAGRCGIPSTARAVSVNLTVVQPGADGFLSIFPGAGATPTSSSINFRSGQIRANNALPLLGAAGDVVVRNGSAATVHFLLDVNGYFE
jgi:aldose sugar dehydrogenase